MVMCRSKQNLQAKFTAFSVYFAGKSVEVCRMDLNVDLKMCYTFLQASVIFVIYANMNLDFTVCDYDC